MSIPTRFFYLVKPLIPRGLQLALRRQLILRKRKQCADVWPILESAGRPPEGWKGWPDGKQFAFVLTHDVDTAKGHDNCLRLAELEESHGFRSSFNFVPERYSVSPKLRERLLTEGFEVGVHGLLHDGKLFSSWEVFSERAHRINDYLREWGCCGFRSPAMQHNLEWIGELDIEYDASTFDTDPFEPQPDGMGTIFPFEVKRNGASGSYIELPYTLPQDFTLFVLMREGDIEIWKTKLDWIAEKGGMALLNTHPDYMNCRAGGCGLEEYPIRFYEEFLHYIKEKYAGQYCHVLPKEMARFWREKMVLRS